MKVFLNMSAAGSQWKAAFPPGLRSALLTAGAMCLFSAGALWAANPPNSLLNEDDVPDTVQKTPDSRAVRLSSVEGQVRVVQDGQVIADPATPNLPLFEGSQVDTGNDGRAEIQLEDGSVARLSPNTTLTFSVLQEQGTATHTEVVVNGGLAYFELQPSNSEHSLRVNYGSASFSATSFSVVRITLDQPPGDLAVFSGNVHLDRGDQLQLDIHGGESLSLDATDQTRYNIADSIEPDSWDSWNADRDQVLNGEAGERTAATGSTGNSGGVGMADLDANGSWYDVPGQGYVWSPYDAQSQGASWDPYGYGQWVNYPTYGYVWTSGYDWGYAPYQCGLWNYYDSFGWGWAPGGGCNPWWGFGGRGWGYNIGNHPRGYLPPRRPLPGPGHPHPVGGPHNTHTLRAASVVPVDRRPAGSANMALYARPTQPVTIGGHTVEPLRPMAPREAYDRPAGAIAGHSGSGFYGSGMRPSNPGNAYNTYRPGQSNARPAMPSYAGRPQSAPAAHPSYSAPAPHPSYSGGGGGHPAGGGGGTHK